MSTLRKDHKETTNKIIITHIVDLAQEPMIPVRGGVRIAVTKHKLQETKNAKLMIFNSY